MHRYLGVIGLAAAAVTAVAVASCTEPDPEYCDNSSKCNCDVVRARCVSAAFDLALDTAMTPPDLTPAPCKDSKECSTKDNPVCGNDGRCSPCRATMDGGTSDCEKFMDAPVCDVDKKLCVECVDNNHCKSKQKTCIDSKCAPCTRHADCATGYCDVETGACAAEDNVYWVDNQGDTPGDCKANGKNGDGTKGKPFCDIAFALAAPARQYILVQPAAKPYGPIAVTVTVKPVTILSLTRLGAQIGTDNGTLSAVSVTGGMSAVNVTVDGFRMVSVLLGAADVVSCKTGATLKLLNSRVESGGQNGVHSSGCSLTLDSVAVLGNAVSGIALDGKDTYKITNCFVVNNTASGVTLGVQAAGQFAFNTVAGNMGPVGGGIACLGAQIIESSVVSRNNQKMGTQFTGCTLKNVVTGPDDAVGADKSAPKYAVCAPQYGAGIDFCLAMDSPGIDYEAASMGTLTKNDYFGAARPQGGKYDVGAQEVR